MTRVLVTVAMAVGFVPCVLCLVLGAAGWFARAWWRVLREVWRG